jgi:hypothetical protein
MYICTCTSTQHPQAYLNEEAYTFEITVANFSSVYPSFALFEADVPYQIRDVMPVAAGALYTQFRVVNSWETYQDIGDGMCVRV